MHRHCSCTFHVQYNVCVHCLFHTCVVAQPGLDTLYTHIKKLSLDPDELSQMEKTTLLEALVLISNEFKDYTKQSAFVADILAHVRSIWLSDAVKE